MGTRTHPPPTRHHHHHLPAPTHHPPGIGITIFQPAVWAPSSAYHTARAVWVRFAILSLNTSQTPKIDRVAGERVYLGALLLALGCFKSQTISDAPYATDYRLVDLHSAPVERLRCSTAQMNGRAENQVRNGPKIFEQRLYRYDPVSVLVDHAGGVEMIVNTGLGSWPEGPHHRNQK